MPMKMEQTECSETSAYKIQTPGNYPKESIQHTEHGESLKLRIHFVYVSYTLKNYSLMSARCIPFSHIVREVCVFVCVFICVSVCLCVSGSVPV